MNNYTLPADDIAGLKTYDLSAVEKAFDHIANSAHIEFDFPQGGCQQRSHVMSMILAKKFKMEHCKIWLFAPAALDENDLRTLFVEDKNKLSPNDTVNWNYHTTPVLKVKNGSKTDLIVIDPSINKNNPITVEEWLKSIGNSNISKYTLLYPEKYFFNCKFNQNGVLTNVFDGTFFDFANPLQDNLAIEKGLAVNDMAMTIHKKHIKPLISAWIFKDAAKLADLKEIFGNATALDLLFAQELSGNTEQTSYRYVLVHHGDLMKEAKEIYTDRLVFWTKFTSELI